MNPDLQHSIGREGKVARELARDQFKDTGFAEGRSIDLPSWDKIFECGNTATADTSKACKCNGVVHLGLMEASDTK
jgi:hypothetical protein